MSHCAIVLLRNCLVSRLSSCAVFLLRKCLSSDYEIYLLFGSWDYRRFLAAGFDTCMLLFLILNCSWLSSRIFKIKMFRRASMRTRSCMRLLFRLKIEKFNFQKKYKNNFNPCKIWLPVNRSLLLTYWYYILFLILTNLFYKRLFDLIPKSRSRFPKTRNPSKSNSSKLDIKFLDPIA